MIYWTDWNIYTLRLPGWIRSWPYTCNWWFDDLTGKLIGMKTEYCRQICWSNSCSFCCCQDPAESIQVAWRLLQVCSPASGRARAPTWARETRLGNWTPLKPPIFEEDYVGILSHFFFQQESVSKMTPSRIQSKVSQKFLPVSFIQVAESRME